MTTYAVQEGSRRAVGIEGLHVTLEALVAQGFVLGIATNDSEAGARATAEALGLTALFSVIIGYDSVARAKPHADQLHLFAAKTGLGQKSLPWSATTPTIWKWPMQLGAGLAIGVLSGNSTLDDLGLSATPSWAPLPNCRSFWKSVLKQDPSPSLRSVPPHKGEGRWRARQVMEACRNSAVTLPLGGGKLRSSREGTSASR